MIHFSCDGCGRLIDSKEEIRYVVDIDVRAKMEGYEVAEDDSDPLQSLEDILESAESQACELVDEHVCRQMKFDLCSTCHQRFMKNPIGIERLAGFTFSKN